MFNSELYLKIYKLRKGSPKYCFPLRMFLGENGLIENHELKGRVYIRISDNEIFTVDNVYVHFFDGGWYYHILAQNVHKSHVAIIRNINCHSKWIENTDAYKLMD